MPRLARFALAALLAIITTSALPDAMLGAQERSLGQLHISIQLSPLDAASAFASGLIDMRFSGEVREWNAGAGTADLSVLVEALPPGPVTMLGSLSWSSADAELPLPPTDVTLSMFAASGDPYRIMVATTPETLFTVVSDSPEDATIAIRGNIHLHLSSGTQLIIDEPVQVRGAARYSAVNEAR